MKWPLGELRALAIKATRGAGFSWSFAEEAGYATQWLESHGVAGVSQLANYLQWAEVNGRLSAPLDMLEGKPDELSLKCPIAVGCFIADSQAAAGNARLRVCQPTLLLPFLALTAGAQTIVCSINNVPIALCADGIDQAALNLPELGLAEASLSWQLTQDAAPMCISKSRASNDKQSIQILKGFADKTYAPATEASRLGGAGAGTTDND